MICPKCGKETPDSSKFCRHCGHDISAVQQAESIDPSPETKEQRQRISVWPWIAGGLTLVSLVLAALLILREPETVEVEVTRIVGAIPDDDVETIKQVVVTRVVEIPVEVTRIVEITDETPMAEGGNTTNAGCRSDNIFCVGLVTDVGLIDDKSFNQSAWEGLLQAESIMGAQIDFIETQDARDYAANIGQFANNGYDIIVTVGFAMGEATAEAARQYPDIDFIGIDQFQTETIDNLAGLIFAEDNKGFLAGTLAAMLTETGTVGQVLGSDLIPPIVAFKKGFEAGAMYINPDINVIAAYHPGGLDTAFTDREWGAGTARQALDQGADVIFGAGGTTGNGALIETGKQESAYCIGVDTDQWLTVPEAHSCLVSSTMKQITPAVFDLLSFSRESMMPSGNYYGPVGLAPFHDFDDVIPQAVKEKLAEIEAGLQSGTIETGHTGSGNAPETNIYPSDVGIEEPLPSASEAATIETMVGGYKIPAPEAGKHNVAFVYVGPHDDGGWTQAHDVGRMYVEENVDNVHTAYVENVAEGTDAEQVIRSLARKGFDTIFTTSFGFMDGSVIVADEFPDVDIIHISGFKSNEDNFGNLMGAMEDMKYLAGMLAGSRAKVDGNPKLGYIATFPVPEELRLGNAFALGAQETCPECTMDVRWIFTWHDPILEQKASKSLFDGGAQVVMTGADTPAPAEAAPEGKWGITYGYRDSCSVPTCLTSMYWNWGPVYAEIVEDSRDGTWVGGWDYFEADTSGMGLLGFMEGERPTPGTADLSGEDLQLIRDTLEQMLAGEFDRFDVFAGPITDNQGNVVLAKGETLEQIDLDSFSQFGSPCKTCMYWWNENVTAELPELQ